MDTDPIIRGQRWRANEQPPAAPIVDVAHDTLSYAASRDYVGWDYSDGMSSRIRLALPFENRWVNLCFQEFIKRAPVNVRPLFLVEQRRSFKGAGLFALAHRNLDRLAAREGTVGRSAGQHATAMDGQRATAMHGERATASGGETNPSRPPPFDHAAAAVYLADWLVENRSPGYSGFCGGHRHQNQHLDHRTLPAEPDVVATSYAVEGLLSAAAYRPRYGDLARTATDFLLEDMNYREVEGGAKIDYYPKDTANHYTLNAGAIAARTLLSIDEQFDDDVERREPATRLLEYVVARQTDRGGWHYRDPPDTSHLSMDNHHNGFVIECLQRYEAVTGDDRFDDALTAALRFYRETLFEADGAPNWDESSSYPRDVHAAAQGILVFTAAGNLQFARRIIDWTLDHLYAGEGRFYYRREKYYTRRVTLMRWCQAWMAYALSTYCLARARRR